MNRRAFLQFGLTLLAGCAAAPTLVPTSIAPTPDPTAPRSTPAGEAGACRPAPLVAPTRPARNPSVEELDPSGLHVTNAGRAVALDPGAYRLKISGALDHPLELSLDDLRCLPRVTATVNLTCKGYFEDVTTYSGVALLHLFDLAGLQKTAHSFTLNSADGYQSFLSREDALEPHAFLAYQWKEEPLPVLHGFPVRAVLPAQLGYAWAKYLVEIQVD